jgi:hypothetical protein
MTMRIPGASALWMTAILVTQLSVKPPGSLLAQVTSETTKTPQSVAKTLTIDSAQVVYVSGDDAVLKMPDGNLRLFELAPGTSLIIDGKPATVSDLTPGTTISHVQLHSRTESNVKTVTQFSGRVTGKNGRLLTVRLDDGTSKIYRVPVHATFNVDGRTTSFDNLIRGSTVTVTAVTTEPVTTKFSKAAMVGQTPQQSGTLVIEK